MTILVSGVVDVDPERRDDALRRAVPFIQGALTQTGCVAYAWTADINMPGRICVFEEWTDEAAFAAHLAGAQYRGMLAHMSQYTIIASDTKKHRVSASEPVYDPTGKPRADFFTV